MLSLGEQQWTLPAGSDTITIGRASNADIRLQADDQISRIHARLNRDGASWTLHDESRNGTGLNGRRLTAPTPLTPGDRIHIGRSVLTFQESTASPTPPAPSDADTQDRPATSTPTPAASAPADPGNEPNPFAPPHQPPAAGNPFTQPDQPPAASPFTQDEQARDAGQVAQADQAPDASSFAQDEQARDAEPVAQPEESPAANPFTPADGAANPFVSAPPAVAPAYDPEGADDYVIGAEAGAHRDAAGAGGYGAAGVVPGFENGDGGTWAAYPSADNPEPVRSPWEISAQIDQSEANWNASAGWPDPTAAAVDRRTGADQQAGVDQRGGGVRSVGRERRTAGNDRRGSDADQLSAADDRLPKPDRLSGDDVGTVRLSRVLIVAGAVIVLGIVLNLVVTFLADGPGGVLRWLVPPGIALVVAMVLALIDAARPKFQRPGRLDVSVLVAVAVVLVGVGIGGFALTAGAEYVGGYLTGNETGEDRLIKPVTKPGTGVTMTVENVTYTSHFTRVEVKLTNTAKEAITVPIDGTTFTAADGTALRADPGRSAWPSRIATGGTEHGTLTFKGHLPDSATAAVLTFKSGSTAFAISNITLTN